jgi:hypothetical protein
MSTVAFERINRFKSGNTLPLFVIAGGGEWAVQYATALQWFIANNQVAVIRFLQKYLWGG